MRNIVTISNLSDFNSNTSEARIEINPYGGNARFARTDPVLEQGQPLVTLQDPPEVLVGNIEYIITSIDTSLIFERLSQHSDDFDVVLISGRLTEINQNLLINSHNFLNNYRYYNLRDHINTSRTTQTHDLGITAFFEGLGESFVNMLNNFISDPIIFRGLGIYIVVFFLEKLFVTIVNRPGLTIRSLITIIRGSLINSTRRLLQNNMIVCHNVFARIHNLIYFFERNGRFLVRRYYRNGFRLRFYLDLTITSIIISGINRFRSLRLF